MATYTYDAVVVGAGPNGLAAAITLAERGWRVLVRERASELGGGARSAELTLPGFRHDICSAVHPLAAASPFFRRLDLSRYGLEWIHSPAVLAHPFERRPAVLVDRSVEKTAAHLGADGRAYLDTVGAVARAWRQLVEPLLGPPSAWVRRPLRLARFGMRAMQPAVRARKWFRTPTGQALFAGHAAHSQLPLERLASASFGLVLAASAHSVGWPIPRGGAQALAEALAHCLRALGGTIELNAPVADLAELPSARAYLLDLTPRQVIAVAGAHLPPRYRRALAGYRYGVAAYKIDWALSEPIPWRDPACRQAVTLHIGGELEEIAAAERAPWEGRTSERPFVILAQPSLFDPTRAPATHHVAWAYCHVPHGSTVEMTAAIEAQIERFAPGFRDCILARHVLSPAGLEKHNPNLVGGDINGGVQDLTQILRRPTWRYYRTPARGIYICSASTPPGGGVHGMCGYHAAQCVLRDFRET